MKRTIRTSKANNWRHKLQPSITKRPIMAQRHAEQKGSLYGRRLEALLATITLSHNALLRDEKRHAVQN